MLKTVPQIAVIGFPFSASGVPLGVAIPPFCLSGTVAAQTALPLEGIQFFHAVYFQGISVKGISGAPIISLKTGKVVAIVSVKLTGIGSALELARHKMEQDSIAMQNAGVETTIETNGIDAAKTVGDLINALDDQLANGLGAGVGASDIANAFDQAKKNYALHKNP